MTEAQGDDEAYMSTSEVMRLAGHPLTDADFIRPSDREAAGATLPYRFNPQVDAALDKLGLWVEVAGGDLVEPVRLRINPGSDGRFVVTGIVLGPSGRQEITSETLRRLRLPEMMRALFDGWDATKPPDPDGDQDEFLSYWLFKEYVVDPLATTAPAPTDTRGPGGDDLRAFAATYLRERARAPRRAMSAAAATHSISRATANRWAIICRERGYLPQREQS